jgi:hypothetical protein
MRYAWFKPGTDKTAAELALKRMGEELVTLQRSYHARLAQAAIAKNNAITLVLVGTILISLIAVCGVSKEIGPIGSLILIGVAVAICFGLIKRICRPINEALQYDLAAIGANARELEHRIAKKKALADS